MMESYDYLQWVESLNLRQIETLAAFPEKTDELRKHWDLELRLTKLEKKNGGPGRYFSANGFTPLEREMQSLRIQLIQDHFKIFIRDKPKRTFWQLITGA